MIEQLSLWGKLERNVSFSRLCTLRVGGAVAAVFYPHDFIAMMAGIDILKTAGIQYKILGNGSNILPSDDDYNGCIIKLNQALKTVSFDLNTVRVGAGYPLPGLAQKCAKEGLSGLEFASGIPGTVGGAIYMNAGAYKNCIYDVLIKARVAVDDELIWISKEDLSWDYRKSVFMDHPDWIVLEAVFELDRKPVLEIESLMRERKERRIKTQPLNYPSAGSIFRNPEGQAAWSLIDSCDLRGHVIGGAKISELHSNFIINDRQGSAADIDSLIRLVQSEVKRVHGIELKTEVEYFNWRK